MSRHHPETGVPESQVRGFMGGTKGPRPTGLCSIGAVGRQRIRPLNWSERQDQRAMHITSAHILVQEEASKQARGVEGRLSNCLGKRPATKRGCMASAGRGPLSMGLSEARLGWAKLRRANWSWQAHRKMAGLLTAQLGGGESFTTKLVTRG